MSERDNLIQLMAKAHLSYGRHFALRSPVPMQGDIDAMSDALAAIEAAGVRLVPVEATEEMAERGDDRIRAWIPMPTYKGDYKEPLEDVYRAMLAASPYAALKETGQ